MLAAGLQGRECLWSGRCGPDAGGAWGLCGVVGLLPCARAHLSGPAERPLTQGGLLLSPQPHSRDVAPSLLPIGFGDKGYQSPGMKAELFLVKGKKLQKWCGGCKSWDAVALPVFSAHAMPMLVLLQQQWYSRARGATGSNSSPNRVTGELSMGMSPWNLGFLISQLPFLHMVFQPCWDT